MTSFILKIIAAVSMLIDHTGLILFPGVRVLRILGRLAMPIYAWCIAEGFRYTRNRVKYFLRVFILGLLCQIVYTIVDRELYLGILITFSLSIILMFCTDNLKRTIYRESGTWSEKLSGNNSEKPYSVQLLTAALPVLALLVLYFALTRKVTVDYGFWGILLPVFASLSDDKWKKLVLFSLCLTALCIDLGAGFQVQYWSLFVIPLLAVYNGKPGKYRMKYFFYIFYPLHMVVLYGISMLI